MSKSKVKQLIIPASKPRNHFAIAVKKRFSGVHISDKDKTISKGKFNHNIKKGIYDLWLITYLLIPIFFYFLKDGIHHLFFIINQLDSCLIPNVRYDIFIVSILNSEITFLLDLN